jgi:hypothetical protein
MKTVTLKEAEQLLIKGLLPKADYSDLNSFLNTISPEDLGEMLNHTRSDDEQRLTYLSYVIGLIFMYEYEQEECTEVDFENLFTQFQRQCVAEICGRLGKWDISQEDRRLIPATEPLQFSF